MTETYKERMHRLMIEYETHKNDPKPTSTTCKNHACTMHDQCDHNIWTDGIKCAGNNIGFSYKSAQQSIYADYVEDCERKNIDPHIADLITTKITEIEDYTKVLEHLTSTQATISITGIIKKTTVTLTNIIGETNDVSQFFCIFDVLNILSKLLNSWTSLKAVLGPIPLTPPILKSVPVRIAIAKSWSCPIPR